VYYSTGYQKSLTVG